MESKFEAQIELCGAVLDGESDVFELTLQECDQVAGGFPYVSGMLHIDK